MTKKGFSIIEILVVVGIFATIAVISTQAVVSSLRSARKTEASIQVKENLDYAISVMERKLRNAREITTCAPTFVNYVDSEGNDAIFRCVNVGGNSGRVVNEITSQRLTSSEIIITQCQFSCTPGTENVSPLVSIFLEAEKFDPDIANEDKSPVSVNTQIYLRIY